MTDLFPTKQLLSGATYFAITRGSDDGENLWSETQTHWIGFADNDRRIEIREISAIHADRMARYWTDFGQPFCVVNDDKGFVRWMLGGGHALITEEQTRKHLPGEMEPRKCVVEGACGLTTLSHLPPTAFRKAPTPRIRMKVLKRDQFRCMICGQRPADDVNIQLHTHHIRPFAERGVTTEKNLITLCHTCHTGLEPHYECRLFDLVENWSSSPENSIMQRELQKYLSRVKKYRTIIRKLVNSSRKERDTIRRKPEDLPRRRNRSKQG